MYLQCDYISVGIFDGYREWITSLYIQGVLVSIPLQKLTHLTETKLEKLQFEVLNFDQILEGLSNNLPCGIAIY